MRIRRPELLRSLRVPGRCELCGRMCSLLCGAHILSKGSGGPDIMLNLVSTAISPFAGCDCHIQAHCGILVRPEHMWAAAAKREKTTPAIAEAVVRLIVRLPKRPRADEVSAELESILDEARPLAVQTLRELGIYE